MNKFKFSTIRRLVLISLISGVGVAHGAQEFTPPGTKYTPDWGYGSGVSLGNDTYSGGNSVAIGAHASTSDRSGGGQTPTKLFQGAVAIGNYAQASQDYAVAIGQSATASGVFSTAIGGQATQDGAVALGKGSVADRKGGQLDAVSFNGEVISADSGAAWVSTYGAASIGSATQTRQLMGVAAGSADTDAVNVAQLKSLQQSSVFGSGASNMITPANNDDPDHPVAAKYAENAAVFGNNGTVKAHNGAAFGYNAQVMGVAEGTALAGNVAIGANSIATMDGRNATVQFKPNDATGGAWASEGLVSFGGSYQGNDASGKAPGEAGYDPATGTVNFNRQLTGVAAGSEDNDAVNVAQLTEVSKNVDAVKAQMTGLVEGTTQVSTIDLLADPGDPATGVPAKGIGLRFEAAPQSGGSAEGIAAQAEDVEIGRLAYTDTNNEVRRVATLNDGITISAGSPSSAAREGEAAPVKVDLNKGISFLTDSPYLSADVAADGLGGAIVTFKTTQDLDNALANAGGNTGGNTGGDSGSSGNTGGSGWTPSQAQLAAMNGNFANGITVAPGEGNQAIQIKQGNVDMGGNRIQNVGNPINDGDAANKAYVDSTSRSLRNKINDVDKDLRAGVAMAMAVGGLPQAYMPGKSIVGVSAGTYHGQGGFALGLSHATDNRQWVFKGAASVDTRGNFGGQLSAGYQF